MAEANRKREALRSPGGTVCPLTAGEQNADLLLDYVSRRLAPETAEIIDRHVAICPACTAFVETQSAVWDALDAFETMPVSEDFDRKLWAKIEREDCQPWWRRILSFDALWKPAIPLAAMALIAVGLWMRPDSGAPNGMPVTKAESRIDVDQIDRTLEDMEMLRELGGV